MIQETEKIIHLAAQYLAAANISFVPNEADDSHTNFGFNVDKMALLSHPFSSKGDQLALNYKEFSLEWIAPNAHNSFPLEGKTHAQVLEWLEQMSLTFIAKPYTYKFHYDLPYAIHSDYTFHIDSSADLEALANLRILSQRGLEQIIKTYHLKDSIRIWPHHFDTGIYTNIPKTTEVMVGLGLAIPDTVSDGHYFYASGYKNGNQIDPTDFSSLSVGNWFSDTFKGGVLPAEHSNQSELVKFYTEALDQFKGYDGQ